MNTNSIFVDPNWQAPSRSHWGAAFWVEIFCIGTWMSPDFSLDIINFRFRFLNKIKNILDLTENWRVC